MGWQGRILRVGRGRVAFGVAAVLGLALAGFSQVPLAWGAALTGFDGFTPLSAAGIDGTINFAVFSLPDLSITGISGAFVPGSGSGGLVTSPGTFLYLYQPVNDGPNTTDTVSVFNQRLGLPGNNAPISPSSWGYFNHTVFCTNASACTTNVAPGTPLPNGATPGFLGNSGAINPSTLALSPNSLVATYPFGPPAQIPDPGTSTLIAFTSSFGPQFDPLGATIAGTGIASGQDPDPAPEPSSILLSAIALGAAFAPLTRGQLRWRRRAAHAS